jgi:hypothetical protein
VSEIRTTHVPNMRQDCLITTLMFGETKFSRLGGGVVNVLAPGPKGCGFITRPRRWIFKDDKNPQHTFLSDGK